jgi:hypothetical protein
VSAALLATGETEKRRIEREEFTATARRPIEGPSLSLSSPRG